MAVLQAGDAARLRQSQMYDTIFDLLSFEKILFNGESRIRLRLDRRRMLLLKIGVM